MATASAGMDWNEFVTELFVSYATTTMIIVIYLAIFLVLAIFSDVAKVVLTFTLKILSRACSFLRCTTSKILEWFVLLLLSLLLFVLSTVFFVALVIMKVVSGTAGFNHAALQHLLFVLIPKTWLEVSEACGVSGKAIDGARKIVLGEREGKGWENPIILEDNEEVSPSNNKVELNTSAPVIEEDGEVSPQDTELQMSSSE
ncbi:MAG: hypothetical protein L6R37_005423 [Teloschistes peruensis]|nr:MAG: hypothetical protein L6R37_005423 [Teloschistes peruensis]